MNIVKKILLGNYPSFLSSIDGDNDDDCKTIVSARTTTTTTTTTQVMENNVCTTPDSIPLSTNHPNNINHSLQTKITVPSDCGIMIELFNCDDDKNDNKNGTCNTTKNNSFDTQRIQQQQQQQTRVLLHTAVPDKLYEHIHPNCHAPAYLHNVHLLHGGGSGTAVFHGQDYYDSTNDTNNSNNNNNKTQHHHHHCLGSIVMKHGGYKDAGEVFSLITIRQELINRIEYQQQLLQREAYSAAERMRYKIPEFVMVYISSYHLRDRQQELWNSLRTTISSPTSPVVSVRSSNRMSMSRRLSTYEKKSSYDNERKLQRTIQLNIGKVDDNNSSIEKWESTPKVINVTINSNIVPLEETCDDNNNNNNNNNNSNKMNNDNNNNNIYIIEDGLDGLQRFAKILKKQMSDHQWKVTIAQKTIGGNNPENGAHVLLSGKLNRYIIIDHDNDILPKINSRETTATIPKATTNETNETNETNNPLLRRLVIDFCQIMEDMSTLTYPHERSSSRIESMLQEIRTVEEALEERCSRNSTSNNNDKINNNNNNNSNEISYHDMDYYTDPTTCISKELDLFVGAAIHKNFDPIDGRFIKLREFAVDILCTNYESSSIHIHDHDDNNTELGIKEQLVCPEISRGPLHTIISEGQLTTDNDNEENDENNCTMPNQVQVPERMLLLQTYILTEHEEIPARFLATLLYKHEYDTMNDNNHDSTTCSSASTRKNSRIGMRHVFVNALSDRSALDEMEDRGWLELLQHATSFVHDNSISTSSRSAAVDCIWTCGLTDAGLHNTFIDIHRGIELFDLGEPRLEPQPAFLTKFLMSYFHTLGMEDDIGSNGKWVQRFNVVRTENGTLLLDLTDETKAKLPQIHDTFLYTLDYFIENIFYGNETVRVLLMKYVILQLLSDSSFCISRWQEKGGGTDRYGGKEKEPLEKWLWRSLWDQYIASYVYTQLLVPLEQKHSWAPKKVTTHQS